MDAPIISRDLIRAKARRDFAASKGRNAHGMNPGALAIKDWQEEWDKCFQAARAAAKAAHQLQFGRAA